jgi:NAD(P)-dependent dehydrogenase (short-subunit alcohol dehydrogenase family)
VRKEEDVQRAVDTAIEHFADIDIVINNASAIATEPTEELRGQEVRPDDGHQRPGHVPADEGRTAAAAQVANAHVVTLAPVEILSRPPADVNGKCFIDSAVLAETGVTDLSRYGGDNPILDIFVDKP